MNEWEIAAKDQADAVARDAVAGAMRTAAICKTLFDAFVEQGFEREDAISLVIVITAGVASA